MLSTALLICHWIMMVLYNCTFYMFEPTQRANQNQNYNFNWGWGSGGMREWGYVGVGVCKSEDMCNGLLSTNTQAWTERYRGLRCTKHCYSSSFHFMCLSWEIDNYLQLLYNCYIYLSLIFHDGYYVTYGRRNKYYSKL